MNMTSARSRNAGTCILASLLQAHAATKACTDSHAGGMPLFTIDVGRRGTALSVTDADAPGYRGAVTLLSTIDHCDVLPLRSKHINESTAGLVTDVTLRSRPCTPWFMNDLSSWTDLDDDMWLVPQSFRANIALGADGFLLDMVSFREKLAELDARALRADRQLTRLVRADTHR